MSECRFVVGDVFETLPKVVNQINEISFCRLNTDWYESTKAELDYLYPLIIKNGFLVLDDYGYWNGSNKALNDYLKENNLKPFRHIIDKASRVFIKN